MSLARWTRTSIRLRRHTPLLCAHAVPWMHAGPNPKGAAHDYNGRDTFQDTSNPFVYPTRVRPARPAHVSARGARPVQVATSIKDAPLVSVPGCECVDVCFCACVHAPALLCVCACACASVCVCIHLRNFVMTGSMLGV